MPVDGAGKALIFLTGRPPLPSAEAERVGHQRHSRRGENRAAQGPREEATGDFL